MSLYDAASPELDQLLQTRINKFVQKKLQVRLFGLLSLLAVVAVFAALVCSLAQHRLAEQWLGVQFATSRVLAEAPTLDTAAPAILQSICESLGWDLGDLWTVNFDTQRLEYIQSWGSASAKSSEFQADNPDMTFESGVGMNGLVWSTGEAIWIADVTKDHRFLRSDMAFRSGLRSAFGFPIKAGDQVVGVMSFFNRTIRKPDANLIQMMSTVGSQVGQFIKRKQVEEALELERRQSEATLREQEELLRMALGAARMGLSGTGILLPEKKSGLERLPRFLVKILIRKAQPMKTSSNGFIQMIEPLWSRPRI